MHDQNAEWEEWWDISPDELAFMQEQPSREFLEMWLGKLVEVIDKYQPDLIWFDGSFDRMGEKIGQEFFAYYFK